jgi:hypothetical protein
MKVVLVLRHLHLSQQQPLRRLLLQPQLPQPQLPQLQRPKTTLMMRIVP